MFIRFNGIFNYIYWYVDTEDHLANSIFTKNNIRVKPFNEWYREDLNYIVVECKVRKKYAKKFEAAIEEIKNKMLLTGHTDYEEFCKTIIATIKGEE